MRKHPGYGRDVIVHAEDSANVHDDVILTLAKDIVYTHHEKWDGTGYPQGLHGRDIPIPGRVMAIVDVYDASTTRQLYRAPLSHDDADRLHPQGPRNATSIRMSSTRFLASQPSFAGCRSIPRFLRRSSAGLVRINQGALAGGNAGSSRANLDPRREDAATGLAVQVPIRSPGTRPTLIPWRWRVV